MFKNYAHVIAALALFVLILASFIAMAWFYPVIYIWATYEDLYGEWGQTYSYAVACLFSMSLVIMRTRYRWFFALLALACLYVFLEEISWGQRLIGFETPELLKRYNLQREANIHNLLVGPISTTTKDVIEYIMAVTLLVYGVLYPLLYKFRWSVARWFDGKGLASPPLYLSPFFLTAAWLELSPLSFNEAEVAELLVGSALTIMAAHYWFVERRRLDIHRSSHWPAGAAPRLALIMVVNVSIISLLSVATTRTLLADVDKRARIEGRILNGYEKFARRYARHDRPDIAVELLLHVHDLEPARTSVLRRIAGMYSALEDDTQFRHYNQKALDIALQKYAEEPDKRSTNLSLARTYKQRGNSRKFQFHADRAVRVALEKVHENPDSAHDAYWLAKVYRMRGNKVEALAEYKRAFTYRPDSTKYRRAYYSMRRKVPATPDKNVDTGPSDVVESPEGGE